MREHGLEGITSKPHPGAAPKLTPRERADLRRRLIRGAQSEGFETDLWTCPRIRQVILSRYGVAYHVDSLPVMLRGLGFSSQKPQLRAVERDEEAIAEWIQKDWKRIKKRSVAKKPG